MNTDKTYSSEKHLFAEELMPTDHKKMMSAVNALGEKYPFLSVTFIGNSILGKSIPMITVGNEEAKNVLYVAAHHGMEWITSALLLQFTDDYCSLIKNGEKVFGISSKVLFETRAVSIIPMLNPDGVDIQINGITPENPLYERVVAMNEGTEFSRWQANARGVDLNHNYDAGFEAYKKLEKEAGILSGRPTRYSGEFPESEPETGSLCNYIRWNDRIKGVLTLHTQGEEIYCSASGDLGKRCRTIGKLLERMTGYKLESPEEMASYGGMTDWLVSKMNIPAFTLECGKGKNPLPTEDFFPIYTSLREALFTFPILL